MVFGFPCLLLSAYHSMDLFVSIFYIVNCSVGLLSSRHSQKQCVFLRWLVTELGTFSNMIIPYHFERNLRFSLFYVTMSLLNSLGRLQSVLLLLRYF